MNPSEVTQLPFAYLNVLKSTVIEFHYTSEVDVHGSVGRFLELPEVEDMRKLGLDVCLLEELPFRTG